MSGMTRLPLVLTAFAASALLSFSALVAPAAAETETETRPLTNFSKVQVSSGVSTTIICGTPARAIVTATDSAGIARVKTDVEGDTLIVRMRGMGSWTGSTNVAITTNEPLTSIQSSSGGSIKVDGCAVSASSLSVQSSSGSSINVAGKTAKVEMQVSSGGSINANALQAESAQVEGSSGGSIQACHIQSVSARASSGASVQVGKGAISTIESSSGGSVSTRNCM